MSREDHGDFELDTRPVMWAKLFKSNGIIVDLSAFQNPPVGRLLVVSPASVTTEQVLGWHSDGSVRNSLKKIEDMYIGDDISDDLWKKDVDVILSDRMRPKMSSDVFALTIRADECAKTDKTLYGYSSLMACRARNGQWYLTLKEYLLLTLMARCQGMVIDNFSRTICAGSRIIRKIDPTFAGYSSALNACFVPAVGIDNGILCIERVPDNFRHREYAPRRAISVISQVGDSVEERHAPQSHPDSRQKFALSHLML